MKQKQKRTVQPQPKKWLIQFRVQAIPACQCVASGHEPGAPARWHARTYQDVAKSLRMLARGMSRSWVDTRMWREACDEQDSGRVRIYQEFTLCDACLVRALATAIIESELQPVLARTQEASGCFLIIADRTTEHPIMIEHFPLTTTERDMFATLDTSPILYNTNS